MPIFFGFSTGYKSRARDIGFKCLLDLESPLLGIEHEEKKSKVFSLHFLEKNHFYSTVFFET